MPDPFCIWTELLLHGRYWSILPKAIQKHLISKRLLLGALHGREQPAWHVLQQNWFVHVAQSNAMRTMQIRLRIHVDLCGVSELGEWKGISDVLGKSWKWKALDPQHCICSEEAFVEVRVFSNLDRRNSTIYSNSYHVILSHLIGGGWPSLISFHFDRVPTPAGGTQGGIS